MKTNRNFLSPADRADLVKIARDGLEEHRIARRANALILLDRDMRFEEVAKVLLIDGSTIRAWLKAFNEGGVEELVPFDLKGGTGALSPLQIDELRAWAMEVLPASTVEVGQFIRSRFGIEYGKSGLIKLMNRIGFDWKKPEAAPSKIDAAVQQRFIDAHEDLRNSLDADETIVYVDAVHPTHQAKPAGRWLPRGQRCAIDVTSGRERLNLHGAIDLETGLTRIKEVQTVDAQSSIDLFASLERAYSTMSRIHVFLDNARYHHARAVQDWLQQPGRRIVLHFVPPYCPHLNPIERLWKVMHENVTHNRRYAKFRDFAEAVLGFLRETVPRRFDEFSSTITDNFRHRPEGFSDPRVTPLYISSWRCFPSWIRHPELTAQGEQRLPPHFQQRPGHPPQFQPRAVNDQVQVARSNPRPFGNRQSARPSAQRRMIRDGQVDLQHSHDRAHQAFGLAQRQSKHRSQCQSRLNGEIGIVRLAARRGSGLRLPTSHRFVVNQIVRLPRLRSAVS